MYGELIPVGGGDPIPLLKEKLLVGRRESCDIILRFSNVSAHHCQLTLSDGYWYVRDQNSRNGVKVNGVRLKDKRVDPGDTLSVATHNYEVKYSPVDNGAVGPPPPDVPDFEMFDKSLLERAGLEKKRASRGRNQKELLRKREYDVQDHSAGQGDRGADEDSV